MVMSNRHSTISELDDLIGIADSIVMTRIHFVYTIPNHKYFILCSILQTKKVLWFFSFRLKLIDLVLGGHVHCTMTLDSAHFFCINLVGRFICYSNEFLKSTRKFFFLYFFNEEIFLSSSRKSFFLHRKICVFTARNRWKNIRIPGNCILDSRKK